MSRRWWCVWSVALLLLAVLVVGPDWYWDWIGRRHHEAFYQGRPTRYWRALLREPSWVSSFDGIPAVWRRDPRAVPVLLELLKDEELSIRWDALLTLRETTGLPADMPQAILPLLKDPKPEFRNFAADSLVMICPDEHVVVPACLPLLHDPDASVRAHLASTLERYAPKAPEIIPALCERLGDTNERSSVRRSAASALGRIGSAASSALPLLRGLLADADVEVRVAAALALWHIGGQAESVLPTLVRALEHPEVLVRMHAVEALNELRPPPPGLVPVLMAALTDPHAQVRWRACGALECLSQDMATALPQAVPCLVRLVQEETHDGTLRAAIRTLGHLGPEAARAVPALAKILERPNLQLRAEAARALAALGPAR